MATPRITKSLLWAARRTLVYRDKISGPWVEGYEGVKEVYPPKRSYFAVIGLFSV